MIVKKMMNPTTRTTTRKVVMMPGIMMMMMVISFLGSFTAIAGPLSNLNVRYPRSATNPTTLPPPTTTPPTTTTPPPTTLPPSCQMDNGDTLVPGEEVTLPEQGGCRICSCSSQAELSCIHGDCAPAVCVDPVQPEGACCPSCPNDERNCRITGTGEVIKAGIQVIRDGQLCECPPPPSLEDITLPFVLEDRFITAVCIDVITIPPTTPPPTTTTTPPIIYPHHDFPLPIPPYFSQYPNPPYFPQYPFPYPYIPDFLVPQHPYIIPPMEEEDEIDPFN